MNTVILISETEILGIVSRHLAQHNSTSMRATRWLIGERSIIAAVLSKTERENRASEKLPASSKSKPKTKKGKKS